MAERVLVVGLDSAPLHWVEKWAGEGRLPNLARLMSKGATGVLQSVNPPLSPAAWSSFATGMFPAKHGVFDHIYRRPGTYDVAPTNSTTRAGKPIWQILSEQGASVGVVNVPETYPPMPVRGFLISGMDTPSDEADFTYPPELKAELQTAVGGYRVFGPRSKENLDRSIAGMHQTIPMRARASRYLWERYQPDLMITVFMEPDVIQHKCWKYMDPAHPEYHSRASRSGRKLYAEAIPDVYTRIDAAIGPWLNSLDDDTTVILMSDHGAGPLYKFLYINNWLVREGLMRFNASALTRLKRAAFALGFTPTNAFDALAKLRLGLVDRATDKIKSDMSTGGGTTFLQRVFLSWSDVDWSRTRAYTLGGNFTGIYVNLRGREPEGCVEPGPEFEALRDEIAARLEAWRDPDTGEAIVERVYRREELHRGPHAGRAPDLIFATKAEAYVGSGGHEFSSKRVMDTSALFNGHHRIAGMVTIAGRGVHPGRLATHRIVDVAPTILHLLGHPVPEDMDGHVIEQALAPDFMASHPVRMGPATGAALEERGAEASSYSDSDEDEILARLSDLGYL